MKLSQVKPGLIDGIATLLNSFTKPLLLLFSITICLIKNVFMMPFTSGRESWSEKQGVISRSGKQKV